MKKFPLEQWFDTEHPIDDTSAALTEAQLMLDAVKRDIDPESTEAQRQCRQMYSAVNSHNRKMTA